MGYLFKYMKKYLALVVVIFILVFLRILCNLYLPTIMSDIVDIGIVESDIEFIWHQGLLMLLISVLGGLFGAGSSFLSSQVGMRFGTEMRENLFKKIMAFSLNEIDQFGTASLITRTTNDVVQIQNVMVMLLRIATMAPLMAIGSIIMALRKDVPLSGVIVVAIILMSIFIGLVSTKAMPIFRQIQSKLDHVNLVMRERLMGIRVIRAFNRVDTEEERFEKANRDLTDTTIKVNQLMAKLQPTMMFLFSMTSVFLIAFGSLRIESGAIGVGDLIAFIQYATQIMFSILMVTMIFVMVPRAGASVLRIRDVLETWPDIIEKENSLKPRQKEGYVEFKDVTFTYQSQTKSNVAALNHISFEMKKGQMTAIIGGTGSGKSTLVHLLARFYDPTEGEILIDGVNLKEMDNAMLRNYMAIVPQQAVLFTGSIEENIRYGKKDASRSDIEKALQTAQASEFVETMKETYATQISQGGTNVSGGQKQRLAIARALIRDARIYVFDDSFSALDFKTEAKLRMALRKELKDISLLVVAQKVTSVMDADQIVVLDQGKMVGKGRHKELLKSCKVYQEIVKSQLSEEEIEDAGKW